MLPRAFEEASNGSINSVSEFLCSCTFVLPVISRYSPVTHASWNVTWYTLHQMKGAQGALQQLKHDDFQEILQFWMVFCLWLTYTGLGLQSRQIWTDLFKRFLAGPKVGHCICLYLYSKNPPSPLDLQGFDVTFVSLGTSAKDRYVARAAYLFCFTSESESEFETSILLRWALLFVL